MKMSSQPGRHRYVYALPVVGCVAVSAIIAHRILYLIDTGRPSLALIALALIAALTWGAWQAAKWTP